ncbi:uncharacterized protein LOC130904472 isoform X2 [Corythoichthys intestinalis]|uniref:uncharacterized protein LOC130904472 isoform X2 n=1 Tax=Corythoichthys intestinalis TaxID=161448 RepID=UPI0025A4F9CB|nr:uncharacterized protein LOC130904472 isoform X2 [Corythoichthys intestinalis]
MCFIYFFNKNDVPKRFFSPQHQGVLQHHTSQATGVWSVWTVALTEEQTQTSDIGPGCFPEAPPIHPAFFLLPAGPQAQAGTGSKRGEPSEHPPSTGVLLAWKRLRLVKKRLQTCVTKAPLRKALSSSQLSHKAITSSWRTSSHPSIHSGSLVGIKVHSEHPHYVTASSVSLPPPDTDKRAAAAAVPGSPAGSDQS